MSLTEGNELNGDYPLLLVCFLLLSSVRIPKKIGVMKITKNIGMLLLGVYLILDGLLGFGLNLGPAIFLLYIVALAAGVLILIGKSSQPVLAVALPPAVALLWRGEQRSRRSQSSGGNFDNGDMSQHSKVFDLTASLHQRK